MRRFVIVFVLFVVLMAGGIASAQKKPVLAKKKHCANVTEKVTATFPPQPAPTPAQKLQGIKDAASKLAKEKSPCKPLDACAEKEECAVGAVDVPPAAKLPLCVFKTQGPGKKWWACTAEVTFQCRCEKPKAEIPKK